MKSLLTKAFYRALFIGPGLLLLTCFTSFAHGQVAPKIQVVTSLFPLQEFAGAVGGGRAEVHLLLPPGAEVHAWEPKPSDVAKISKADIFIYLGPFLEPWAHKVIKAVQGKNLVVVEAGRGLPFLEADQGEEEKRSPVHAPPHSHGHGHSHKIDPHIWLDFSLDLKIVDAILSACVKKDPKRAGDYQKNAEAYKAQLIELDKRYRESLASCRHRRIIMGGHAAFGYLARRYGLKQTALSGVSPDAEPTPKRMVEILEQGKKTGGKYIFAEELVHPKTSQTLAKEAGVRVLLLNPGGNLTGEQVRQKLTFTDLMQNNLENLREGLECEAP